MFIAHNFSAEKIIDPSLFEERACYKCEMFQEGVPGPSDGLGGGRSLGLDQAGLHPPAVPRPHPGAPPGRGHRALRQQDAR